MIQIHCIHVLTYDQRINKKSDRDSFSMVIKTEGVREVAQQIKAPSSQIRQTQG